MARKRRVRYEVVESASIRPGKPPAVQWAPWPPEHLQEVLGMGERCTLGVIDGVAGVRLETLSDSDVGRYEDPWTIRWEQRPASVEQQWEAYRTLVDSEWVTEEEAEDGSYWRFAQPGGPADPWQQPGLSEQELNDLPLDEFMARILPRARAAWRKEARIKDDIAETLQTLDANGMVRWTFPWMRGEAQP
jgi:hypothetical protein